MEKKMEKEKNIIFLVNYLKVNIYVVKNMEKEENIVIMIKLYLKENIYMILK